MSGDDDFKTQLALEELERQQQQQQLSHASAGDPYIYTDATDGTVYEWNHEKLAWFPKISDDFIAAYQANYGTVADGSPATSGDRRSPAKDANISLAAAAAPQTKPGEKPKANEPQGWFDVDDEHNTNVYVSNLPTDVTEEEFEQLMSKCGIILRDQHTSKLKMKLYCDSTGMYKGDALCCYLKVESVHLALSILDGYDLRGKRIHVERAKFQMKGDYDPTKKPKRKPKEKQKDKEKLQKVKERLLDWRPERQRGERAKHERTVVIKNMFKPKEFEEDATLILEYKNDLREECSKFGMVKKVVLYDRHEEGVATVTFEEAEMGDACVAALNGRWFAGQQLAVHTWDGKSRYAVQESELERQARLKQWDEFLEKEALADSRGGASK